MRKDIIVCIIIILLILIMNYLTVTYSKINIDSLENDLSELKEKLLKEEDNSENKFKNLKQRWNDVSDIMAFYIEHDEIEKIDTAMTEIETNIEVKEIEHAIVEVDKCKFILEHIKDKIVLNLKNIF